MDPSVEVDRQGAAAGADAVDPAAGGAAVDPRGAVDLSDVLRRMARTMLAEPGDRIGDARAALSELHCMVFDDIACQARGPGRPHVLPVLKESGETVPKHIVSIEGMLEGLPPLQFYGDYLFLELQAAEKDVPLSGTFQIPAGIITYTPAQQAKGIPLELVAMVGYHWPRRRGVDVHRLCYTNTFASQWDLSPTHGFMTLYEFDGPNEAWASGQGWSRVFDGRPPLPVDGAQLPEWPSLLLLRRAREGVAATARAPRRKAKPAAATASKWMHAIEAMSPVLLRPANLLEYLHAGSEHTPKTTLEQRAALLWLTLFDVALQTGCGAYGWVQSPTWKPGSELADMDPAALALRRRQILGGR